MGKKKKSTFFFFGGKCLFSSDHLKYSSFSNESRKIDTLQKKIYSKEMFDIQSRSRETHMGIRRESQWELGAYLLFVLLKNLPIQKWTVPPMGKHCSSSFLALRSEPFPEQGICFGYLSVDLKLLLKSND